MNSIKSKIHWGYNERESFLLIVFVPSTLANKREQTNLSWVAFADMNVKFSILRVTGLKAYRSK